MAVTKETVLQALSRVQHPTAGGDAASAAQKVAVCDGYVSITFAGDIPPEARAQLIQHAAAAVRLSAHRSGDELADVHIDFAPGATGSQPARPTASSSTPPPAPPQQHQQRNPNQPPQSGAQPLPGIKHAIAVGAGKGGVGKSTVSVNLAVALARKGYAVGLLDGDIYGPSLPTMLGLAALDPIVIDNTLQPFAVHGVKAMTIGKLVDPEKPLIWRGPMAHGAFKQLTEQTAWGELDYLIIDLPPGTGDVSLTMAQLLRLTGAVVVCTPQRVAQDDAVRAARMFQQLGIDILGVVENMSYFIGDDGKEYDIFGRGGAEQMAQRLGLPFLGAVPINMALRENSDRGDPTANFTGNPALARELETLAANLESQVALASLRTGGRRPSLTIS